MSREVMQDDSDPCPRKMAAQWRDASMQALADLSKMRLRVLRQDAAMRQARQDAVMRQARQDAVMRQALEAIEERYVGALRDNALDALRAALGEK